MCTLMCVCMHVSPSLHRHFRTDWMTAGIWLKAICREEQRGIDKYFVWLCMLASPSESLIGMHGSHSEARPMRRNPQRGNAVTKLAHLKAPNPVK